MKSYASITAFAKNRNTPRVEETWNEWYLAHQELCKISGMFCFAYVVFLDKDKNVMNPSNKALPDSVEYMFRFDPITDKQYEKYNEICAKWGNPEWIQLS